MKARYLLLALAALSLAACTPEDTPKVDGVLEVSGVKDNQIVFSLAGEAKTLTVKSNVSWTAICDADWLTVDPKEGTVANDGKTHISRITVTAEPAISAERESTLTISAEGAADVVINLVQHETATFEFSEEEVEYPYCEAAVTVVPSDDNLYYRAVYGPASLGIDEFVSFILQAPNSYLSQFTPEDILEGLADKGESTLELEDLEAETDYKVVALGIKYDESSKQFVSASAPATYTLTTEAAPVADEAYAAIAGLYTCKVYDDFAEGENEALIDLQMAVEPAHINETYAVYFIDGLTPISDNYIDTYVGVYNKATKEVIIPNAQIGSLGAIWNVGELGSCACALMWEYVPENEIDEVPALENVPFVLGDDNASLSFNSVVPENAVLSVWSAWVNNVDGSWKSTGYANGSYSFTEGTTLTKIQSLAPAKVSLPAIKAVKGMDKMPVKVDSKKSIKF